MRSQAAIVWLSIGGAALLWMTMTFAVFFELWNTAHSEAINRMGAAGHDPTFMLPSSSATWIAAHASLALLLTFGALFVAMVIAHKKASSQTAARWLSTQRIVLLLLNLTFAVFFALWRFADAQGLSRAEAAAVNVSGYFLTKSEEMWLSAHAALVLLLIVDALFVAMMIALKKRKSDEQLFVFEEQSTPAYEASTSLTMR